MKAKRIAGYVRVSHDEQKKYGYSVQAQIERIIRYAEECRKENKEKRFILMGSTFINGRYKDYTDENYNEGKEHLKRKEIPSFNANTNQKESINHNQGYGF